MPIHVLFFGAVADITGKREIATELPGAIMASDIFKRVLADHPNLADHKLYFSVNQRFANGNEIVRDGDELAIFTAFSGG